MSKLQEKPLDLKREHQNEMINFFLCLWIIFALQDPDPDPGTLLNPDPIRIRIHSTARNRATALLEIELQHLFLRLKKRRVLSRDTVPF